MVCSRRRAVCVITLAVAVCLSGRAAAAGVFEQGRRNAARSDANGCGEQGAALEKLQQAGQLMEQSRYADVIALLGAEAPKHCDARLALILSGAYEGSGDVAKAEMVLEDAHAKWPLNTGVATSLAREYLSDKETEKAVEALGGFRVTKDTPPQEMEEASMVYLAGHRLEEARKVAEAANRRYPSLQFLLLDANVLQLEGRYKDVNLLMAAKRGSYGNSPAFLVTAAESEFDAMLYDRAQKDLGRAIVIDPNLYQAHFLLGNLDMTRQDFDGAEAQYKTAIELAPNQPRSYYQLALVYKWKQDITAEQVLVQKALIADDHYAPAYCEYGRILVYQHQYAEAIEKLKLAIQYNPQTEQAYYLLSRAYASLGDREKGAEMAKLFTKVRDGNRKGLARTAGGDSGVGPNDSASN